MTHRISLALQGGGAHGAFTWGALDRLLEDGRFEIAAISGTSAGALNGAALKAGLVAGGTEGARERLRHLWEMVIDIGDFRSLPWMQPFLPMMRFWQGVGEVVLPVNAGGMAAQMFTPYDWGALWENPLEPVVRDLDFSHVRAGREPQLYIGATNVRTGKAHVFHGQEITPEALMASACLPTVFQAVEIDGESYWDGGFAGNPSLWPLYHLDLPDDIVIVQVNPLRREALPRSPLEIQDRMSEIGFNTALMSELRAIAFVKRLIAEGRIEEGKMKDVRVHMIHDAELVNSLTASSKLEPGQVLIDRLFKAGRGAAEVFLTRDAPQVGKAGTVELQRLFA